MYNINITKYANTINLIHLVESFVQTIANKSLYPNFSIKENVYT